jgi:hypothetical protein
MSSLIIASARAGSAGQRAPDRSFAFSGDVNDPGSILSSAREKLDFSQPVAIMLMGMLALNEAVDNDQSANDALDGYNQTGAVPYRARRADQIVRFFDGLELVDPGIVQLQA